MSKRDHWDEIYASKHPESVSWYRPRLEQSLSWIDACGIDREAHIVDAGGGASTLVDDLLRRDFQRVSVADISAEALAHSQARLGDDARLVQWVVGDVAMPLFDEDSVDLWHDRAVFHFLTEPASREAYIRTLRRSLRPGGFAIIATFGPNGPERCSGLPVRRYSSSDIAAEFGRGFELLRQTDEVHCTPAGGSQAFAYVLLERSS